MNSLAATCLNAGISRFQRADPARSLPYLFAARHFDDDKVIVDSIATVLNQIHDEIEKAIAAGETVAAVRLDDLHLIFAPAHLPLAEARRRAVNRVGEAESAIEAGDLAAAAAHCLAALALDSDNAAAQDCRSRIVTALYEDYRVHAEGPPALEPTLTLSVAVAMGAAAPHREALAALLIDIGEFDLAILQCETMAQAAEASIVTRHRLSQIAWTARLRRDGVHPDAATAQAKEKADLALNDLGEAETIDTDGLALRAVANITGMRYGAALKDLRELSRRMPNAAWITRNICMMMRNILHPDVPAAIAHVVETMPDDVDQMAGWFGSAWAMGAVDETLILAERLSAKIPAFRMVSALHEMATDLSREPALRLGEPGANQHKIYANVVCWGAKYVDLMETTTVASLLAPGNFPSLSQRADIVLDIVTMPEDLERLRASEPLRRLSAYCEIRIYLFPAAVEAHKRSMPYLILGFGSHLTILRAERDGADIIFLFPDLIYADGSFRAIAELVTTDPRAVFTDGLNAYLEPVMAEIGDARRSGALEISGDQLIDLASRHLSKRSLNHFYQPGGAANPSSPVRVVFRTEQGLRIHSFVMGPTYVTHAAFAPMTVINFGTCDGMFTSHLLNRLTPAQIEVMQPSAFCFVEVCEDDGSFFPLEQQELKSAVLRYFRDFGLNERRLLLFERATYYPIAETPPDAIINPDEIETRIREIKELFASHPIFVDGAAERDKIIARHYAKT